MSTRLSLTLLIIIAFLVYLPSFGNQFLWDDEQFIYRNQYVLEFNLPAILTENTIAGAGEKSNYYRPLTTFTFALDHALWGLSPFGFHLTNTTFHALAGALVFLLLKELGLKKPAFWIAALFLLHPIQTEAVTYINSRGDSLFAFFSLLSLYSFLLGLKQKTITLKLSDRDLILKPWHFLAISLSAYPLGLFSKEIGIAAVGMHTILLIRDFILSKQKLMAWVTSRTATLVTWTGLVITAVSYLLARATFLNFNNSFNFYGYESEYTSNLGIRLLTFSKTLWWYWRLLFVPYPLHMERDMELVTSFASPWPWATLIALWAIFGLGLYEWKKKHSSWIWVGWVWFFIWISPMSGLIPINGLIYEHWLYMPMIGFWVSLYGILKLLNFKLSSIWITRILTCILIIAALLTIRQNYIWRAPIPFYEYTLQHASSARLHNNLAMAYDEAGNTQKAINEYLNALSISDVYPQIYYNLGNSYAQINQVENAEKAYLNSLALSQDFIPSYIPLINLYLTQEKYEAALPYIEYVLQRYPQEHDLWLIHGKTLWHLNRSDEAEESFEQARIYSANRLQTNQLIQSIQSEKTE